MYINDEVDDYDVLKAQLLKRFRLTEGGYRKRFKTGKLEPGLIAVTASRAGHMNIRIKRNPAY